MKEITRFSWMNWSGETRLRNIAIISLLLNMVNKAYLIQQYWIQINTKCTDWYPKRMPKIHTQTLNFIYDLDDSDTLNSKH